MVGVSNTSQVSKKTIEWLSSGGREQIYCLVKKLEKQLMKEGKIGDFSCLIGLPQDVILCEEFPNGGRAHGRVNLTKKKTPEYWRNLAEKATRKANGPVVQRVHDKLMTGTVGYRATIKTGKDVYGLADNEIFTDFSWHGHDGAAMIFSEIGHLIETNCGSGSASWL